MKTFFKDLAKAFIQPWTQTIAVIRSEWRIILPVLTVGVLFYLYPILLVLVLLLVLLLLAT
jgi:hypothetical protein